MRFQEISAPRRYTMRTQMLKYGIHFSCINGEKFFKMISEKFFSIYEMFFNRFFQFNLKLKLKVAMQCFRCLTQ